MSTAPQYWNQVLDTQRCVDLEDFMTGIKYHEEALVDMDDESATLDEDMESRIRKLEELYDYP